MHIFHRTQTFFLKSRVLKKFKSCDEIFLRYFLIFAPVKYILKKMKILKRNYKNKKEIGEK